MVAKKKATPAKKPAADWESIEREYRAGMLSIREIAKRQGITDKAIRNKAKKEGWQRDLSEKVRERVRAESVRAEVRTSNASDEEIVEEAAARGVEVIRVHRSDIRRGRTLVEMMFTELEDQCSHHRLLEEMAEQHIDVTEASQQAANAIRKAVSLPGRAGTLRDLSQSLQRLVTLERQAHNLNDGRANEGDALADLLDAVDGKTRSI